MSLLKAFGKYCAKKVSRQVTNRQVSNAKDKAYKETGKQMEAARKEGRYIDGSKAYRDNKRKIIRSAYQNGRDRENFINDI